MVAGTSGMTAARFYAVDACAAGLFALAHILSGMAIGASLTVLHAIAGRLVVLVLILALAVGLLVWLTPWAIRQAIGLLTWLRGPVRQRAEAGDGLARRLVRSLLDPDQPEVLGVLILGLALIGGLWLFLGVLQDVIAGDPLVRADRAVFHLLQSLRLPVVDQIMVALTELGDAAVVVPVLLAGLAWLVWRRAWRAALYGVAAVAGASLFAFLLKITLQQTRPGGFITGGTLTRKWSSARRRDSQFERPTRQNRLYVCGRFCFCSCSANQVGCGTHNTRFLRLVERAISRLVA